MANKLSLIYQDSNVVAVNKPAGLASIPGRGETTSVLEELARQLSLPCRGDTDPRLRVVHRLDKDTSGVLAFALNIEAQRYLSHQFQNNTVQKQYLALVVGRPPEEEGEIDAPIMHDPFRTLQHAREVPAADEGHDQRHPGPGILQARRCIAHRKHVAHGIGDFHHMTTRALGDGGMIAQGARHRRD